MKSVQQAPNQVKLKGLHLLIAPHRQTLSIQLLKPKPVSIKTQATTHNSLPRKNKIKKASQVFLTWNVFFFWKGTPPDDPLMSETVQEKKQERKAAKTLSFILLVFLITWTPYNVLAVMKAILGPEHEVIFKKL